MTRKLLTLFDKAWLPALLVAGTTWLYAPLLHHAFAGDHLQLISTFEGVGQPLSTLFRWSDAVAALIVLLVIWRARMFSTSRALAIMLVGIAVLNVVDVIFAVGCRQTCDIQGNGLITQIHDLNSVVVVVAVAVAAIIDSIRHKATGSRIFVAVQLAAGLAALIAYNDKQGLFFIQYVYQAGTIVWTVYILKRFMPEVPSSFSNQQVRRLFAVLLFVVGCLELLLALHVRSYGVVPGFLTHAQPLWLAQSGVLAGAVLIFFARQLYQGQRRAAVLVCAVLIILVIKYSLLTPHFYSLALSELLLIFLYMHWSAFNRNIGVPPLVARLRNAALLLAGVSLAIVAIITVASLSGRLHTLSTDSEHLLDTSATALHPARGPARAFQARVLHLRYVSSTLVIVVIAFIIWSLFQPATSLADQRHISQKTVRRLLDKFSNSSEDYFKLWPEDKTYFTVTGIDGFVAYKKVGGTVFALADPISSKANRPKLLAAFLAECHKHGWSACFFVVGAGSRDLYHQAGLKTFQIGSSAVIPIDTFTTTTIRDKWWRWKMNRSKELEYSASQPPHTTQLLSEVKSVSDAWLQRAGHTEQGFALGHYDADYLNQCPLHLLRNQDGQLVAFTNQMPSFNNTSQATVDLIRFRPDTEGTMPPLIAHVLGQLASEQTYKTFDLGFVPLAKLQGPLSSFVRVLTATRFSAAGLEQFKDKFRPDWQPEYLAYEGDILDLTALISRLEKALRVS